MERNRKRVLPTALGIAAVAALGFIGTTGVGCEDEFDDDFSEVDYAYEDPYLYSYYYPADLAYSGMYWGDPWDYGYYYYQVKAQADGGVATTPVSAVGAAIRALARGETVCPGQVTVTPRSGTPACASAGVTSVRSGVNMVFAGCQLSGGGVVDGTVDVESSRVASDTACNANTTITLTHKTTITNLTYTSPDGRRLVIPSQTDSGSNTYPYGQLPTVVTINSTGNLQTYNSNGDLTADLSSSGTRTYTFSAANRTYAVSGTVNVQNNLTSETASLVGTNITRTQDCCRPTGGMVVVNRSGGDRPGQHTWSFGATCDEVSYDGTTVTLPACY